MKIAMQMDHEYSLVFRESVYLKYSWLDYITDLLAFSLSWIFYGTLDLQNEQTEMKLHFLNAELYYHCFIAFRPSQQLDGR